VLIYGKGGKTRAINLPASLWSELQALRGDADVDTPIFSCSDLQTSALRPANKAIFDPQ